MEVEYVPDNKCGRNIPHFWALQQSDNGQGISYNSYYHNDNGQNGRQCEQRSWESEKFVRSHSFLKIKLNLCFYRIYSLSSSCASVNGGCTVVRLRRSAACSLCPKRPVFTLIPFGSILQNKMNMKKLLRKCSSWRFVSFPG